MNGILINKYYHHFYVYVNQLKKPMDINYLNVWVCNILITVKNLNIILVIKKRNNNRDDNINIFYFIY